MFLRRKRSLWIFAAAILLLMLIKIWLLGSYIPPGEPVVINTDYDHSFLKQNNMLVTTKGNKKRNLPKQQTPVSLSNEFQSPLILDMSQDVFSKYPLQVDLPDVVNKFHRGEKVDIKPINEILYSPISVPTCGKNPDLFMVYIIKSHPQSVRCRMAIRQTWGREELLSGVRIKRIFSLGSSTMKAQQDDVIAEHSLYGDILLGDYQDTYNHTTLKLEYGLQWIKTSCDQSKFYVFVDDDVLINPKALHKLLMSHTIRSVTKLFLGWFEGNHVPSRTIGNKWYLSFNDYPFLVFPPIAPAATYILNRELVHDIIIAMKFVKKVKFDDVYLAIVAKKLGIFPTHTDLIDVAGHAGPNGKKKFFNSDIIAVWDEFSPDRLIDTWQLLQLQLKD